MRHLTGLLLFVAAAGCGVEDDPRPASFDYIQAAILTPSCATAACHSSQNQRQGLVLDDPETGYAEFTGTGIDPADPPNSGILLRLRGQLVIDGAEEDRMPLDSPLPDSDIALIERWLVEGFQDN